MCTTIRKVPIKPGQIRFWVEGDWSQPVIDGEKLLQVKDLNVMVVCFGGDDDVVLVGSDFSP